MDEELEKIDQMLHWAVSKNFTLTNEEWLKLGDRAEYLTKKINTERFRNRVAAVIGFISQMSKIV